MKGLAATAASSSAPSEEEGTSAVPGNAAKLWKSAKRKVGHGLVLKLPLPDPPGTFEANVGGIDLVHDSRGQHTIKWKQPLKGHGTELAPGECCLYGFPCCTIGKRVGVVPDDDQVEVLIELLISAAQPREHIFFRRDPSGATPIHAILIANNPEALNCTLRLYASVPSLLMQTHGPGFFVGESGLHVLAVNRREEELCDALALADELLTTPQYVELLCVQAAGNFFRSPPSLFYGGTILGYAASFNLKAAVRAILVNKTVAKEVDLANSPECACKITGFLPLHAAAANGMTDMFDYLVGRESQTKILEVAALPEECRADKNLKTSVGEKLEWGGLSSLQLAAKLGDELMCKHILRERLKMNWKWGPLTSLSLPLNEIESAYEQDAGLMELVAHFDARPATQAMLLDDFMQGFLHQLFVQKWHRFGKYLFYTIRFFEITLLVLQLILAFQLKSKPTERFLGLAIATLSLAVSCTLYEAWVVSLWWRNEAAIGSDNFMTNLIHKLHGLQAWLSGFGIGRRVVSYILTTVGCAMYIEAYFARRAGEAATYNEQLLLTDGKYDEPLWTLFALGASFSMHTVIASLCVSPNAKDLGVFSITIDRMFANDVMMFLIFLSFFLMKYWVAMYISFPRAGTTTLPAIAPFDNPYQAFKALLDAAIYQKRFMTDWDAIDPELWNFGDEGAWTAGHWVAMALFTYFHLMFAITCMILLVRLLMAMMTNTFQAVNKKAQLEWRLLIARNVLRLELVFTALVSTCCVPEKFLQRKFAGAIPPGDTKHVHTFLHVEHSPDAASSVPLLLAQQGGNDLYDAEEQKAAAALRAKRELKAKQKRDAKRGTGGGGLSLVQLALKSEKGESSAAAAPSATAVAAAAKLEREKLRGMLADALAVLDGGSDKPAADASPALPPVMQSFFNLGSSRAPSSERAASPEPALEGGKAHGPSPLRPPEVVVSSASGIKAGATSGQKPVSAAIAALRPSSSSGKAPSPETSSTKPGGSGTGSPLTTGREGGTPSPEKAERRDALRKKSQTTPPPGGESSRKL